MDTSEFGMYSAYCSEIAYSIMESMHVSNVVRPVAIFHEFSFRVHPRGFEKLRMHSPHVKLNLGVKRVKI